MTDRELLKERERKAQEQINWTCSRISDSQEHAQIVRLEARLVEEQATLARIQAALKENEHE